MKELTFKQMEDVNGGVVLFVAAVVIVDLALIGVMVGMQQEMAN